MRLLERGNGPALRVKPVRVPFRPGPLRGGRPPPMTEEKLREPMSGAQQIRADIFPAAQEIAGGLFLFGRDVNRGERAGPIEDRELGRVAAVRLDAIAGPPRDERWRDHVTRNGVPGQRTLELEAAGTGFVAALHGRGSQALYESQNGRTV